MNEWAAQDLFGRDGSFLYAPEYLIFFAVAILTAIVLPLLLRKLPLNKVQKVLVGMWLGLLVLDIIKYNISWSGSWLDGESFNIKTALPLHACSSFWYVAPIAFFSKNEKIKSAACCYLCTVNMFGGIIGMFMSTDMMACYSLFSIYGSENMIYHSMLFIIASVMLGTGYYKPKKQHVLRGYLVFLCIAIPTFIFDCIFKADYMYIYDCSLLGIFKPIADAMPHRLVWTLVAFASYFIITVVFYFIALGISLLCNKNKKTEQIEEKEEAMIA